MLKDHLYVTLPLIFSVLYTVVRQMSITKIQYLVFFENYSTVFCVTPLEHMISSIKSLCAYSIRYYRVKIELDFHQALCLLNSSTL